MPPPSKAAAGLLPALAALLLLGAQPAAAAAQRGERRLLAKPITLPSDAAKSAVVNPAPPPPPEGPALLEPSLAEKCAVARRRAAPSPPPAPKVASAGGEGTAAVAQGVPDAPAAASAGSALLEPSLIEKCGVEQRPMSWEEWAAWLEANDAKVDALFSSSARLGRAFVERPGRQGARDAGPGAAAHTRAQHRAGGQHQQHAFCCTCPPCLPGRQRPTAGGGRRWLAPWRAARRPARTCTTMCAGPRSTRSGPALSPRRAPGTCSAWTVRTLLASFAMHRRRLGEAVGAGPQAQRAPEPAPPRSRRPARAPQTCAAGSATTCAPQK